MAWIAGVDGCKGGWIAVYALLEAKEITDLKCRVAVCEHGTPHTADKPPCNAFAELMKYRSPLGAVAVDMPIGLWEKGGRDCDKAARKTLGKRSRSIFSAPASVVLEEWKMDGTYDQAKIKKSLSRQSWALVPKIAEVARYLENHPGKGRRIHEAHPEVSFAELNGGQPMCHSKKTLAGFLERRALLKGFLGNRVEALEAGAPAFDPGERVGPDDFYDALACLWTARRICQGEARALPGCTPVGSASRPMRIVY